MPLRVLCSRLGPRTVYAALRLAAAFTLVMFALGGIVVLAPRHPRVRAALIRHANQELSETFQGRIKITHLDAVGWDGFSGASAVLEDAVGHELARVEGVAARLNVPSLMWHWFVVRGPLPIDVWQLDVGRAEVWLFESGDAGLTLARALELRHGLSVDHADDRAPPQRVKLQLAAVGVAEARVHGRWRELPAFDAQLSTLSGMLTLGLDRLDFQLTGGHVNEPNSTRRGPIDGQVSGECRIELGELHGALPSGLALTGRFDGSVAGIPATFTTRFAHPRLEAELVFAGAAPLAVQRWLPLSGLRDLLSASLRLEGEWPRLSVKAGAALGSARFEANGSVVVSPALAGMLQIHTEALNLAALFAEFPDTGLRGDAALRLDFSGGQSLGLDFDLAESTIAGYRSPPLHGRVEWVQEALRGTARADSLGAVAQLKFDLEPPRPGTSGAAVEDEPRAAAREVDALQDRRREATPAEVTKQRFALRSAPPIAAPRVLRFEVSAESSDLLALARMLHFELGLAGRARIEGTGTLSLGAAPQLDARLSLIGADLRRSQFRLGELHAEGRLRGVPAHPHMDVTARARHARVRGLTLPQLELEALGSLEQVELRAQFEGGPFASARLQARVDALSCVVRDLEVVFGEPGSPTLTAAAVDLGCDGSVRLDRLRLDGAGTLEASGQLRDTEGFSSVRGTDLDLALIAKLLGLPTGLSGRATFTSTVRSDRNGHWNGEAAATTNHLVLPGVPAASFSAHLQLHDGLAMGDLTVAFATLGQATLRLNELNLHSRRIGSIAEFLQSARDWQLESTLDLATLAQQLADPRLNAWQPSGMLHVGAHLQRQGSELPDVDIQARTEGLRWSWPDFITDWSGASVVRDAPLSVRPTDAESAPSSNRTKPPSQSVELMLALHLLGDRGRAEGELRAITGQNPVVDIAGHAELPIAVLLHDPGALSPCEVPLDVTLRIPERALDTVPLPFRVPPQGRGQLDATLSGTLHAPSLDLALRLAGLTLPSETVPGWAPLDVAAHGHYRQGRVDLDATVNRQSARILDLALEALVSPGSNQRDCAQSLQQVSARLSADHFPLQLLGSFGRVPIAGELGGHAELQSTGSAPRITAKLSVDALQVGRQRTRDHVALDLTSLGDHLDARAELRQPDGRAHATLRGQWAWPQGLLPSVRARRIDVDAANLDLTPLTPWLGDGLATLGGRVDARLTISNDTESPDIQGVATLRQGSIQVPSLGQRLSNIEARLEVNQNELTLQNASAEGFTGRIEGHGSAHLDGFRPASVRLEARVDQRQAVPITLEGVPLGQAWGTLALDAQRPSVSRPWTIQIAAPTLHVEVPEEPLRGVQSLEADATVETGVFVAPEHFVPLLEGPAGPRAASQATAVPLNVRINLGRDVWVQRGTMARVQLDGAIDAQVSEQLALSGRLQVNRGKLIVQGKAFEIQDGSVTFHRTEKPNNPTVVATATWDSSDRIRVYADYVGPVATGKLTLRSEPKLNENEILSLLLFGSSGGPVPTTTTGAKSDSSGSIGATAALAASAGVVSGGLNRALARFTRVDIQTRIGEHKGTPLPEVAVQLTPRLSAEVAYALGTALPGQTPDRTFVTLDLRLFSNWSLSSTVGDQGSTLLDLLWLHRY